MPRPPFPADHRAASVHAGLLAGLCVAASGTALAQPAQPTPLPGGGLTVSARSLGPGRLTGLQLRPPVARGRASPATVLVYELRTAGSPGPVSLANGSQGVRGGIEFKSARHPAQTLRSGLLRVELGERSTLTLRPRGGGLVISYRSQF